MKFKKKETFKQKIEDWWHYVKVYKIEIPYRDFIRGVKNIFKWAKIVWEDADWDHRYIITTLQFKIKNTADYITKTQRHLNWEEDVKYMRICIKLIDKLWGDFNVEETQYESEYTEYHESEYTWIPTKGDYAEEAKKAVTAINRDKQINNILSEEEEDMLDLDDIEVEIPADYDGDYLMDIKEVSETFDDYFAKNKLMHRKAIQYLKVNRGWSNPTGKFTQAMIISKLKHDKAKRLLFKILEEKIEHWWD